MTHLLLENKYFVREHMLTLSSLSHHLNMHANRTSQHPLDEDETCNMLVPCSIFLNGIFMVICKFLYAD